MFGKGKKKTARMDTLVGVNSEIIGDIKFSGGLHVDGIVQGNIVAEGENNSLVQLSDKGTIKGEVKAPFITLNGVVVGDVYGSDHVGLEPKARVTGDVYYGLIEMAMGAEVNGRLVHIPGSDNVLSSLEDMEPMDNIPGTVDKEFE